jgi:replicative DNA helicase Mcm
LNDNYKDALATVFDKGLSSLELDFHIMEEYDFELADQLIKNPIAFIEDLNRVAGEFYTLGNPHKMPKIHFKFTNFDGNNKLYSLEDLGSQHISKIVSFEGIVKRRYKPRPVLDIGVFECRSCQRLHEISQKGDVLIEPGLCQECGTKTFRLNKKLSKFKDIQEVILQDSFDKTKGRNQPIDRLVLFEENMINQVNPGELIRVVGIVDLFEEKKRNGKTHSDYIIYANNYHTLVKAFDDIEISDEDIETIKELSKDPNIFQRFTDSVAPSIMGYTPVKQAIVAQLFGGTRKELSNGEELRPDIHIFLIGDPSVGKSKMLKFVSDFAPGGIFTSGKGTSAAGLTAAVVKDDRGNFNLEAGALVLADMAYVCVDELDKMSEEDRSALHEAMESQTVSIDKAGIHSTLKTRTSMLAAANPKFGQFDKYKSITEQIDLGRQGAPLLSRFDLIFVLEDDKNKAKDDKLSRHILQLHTSGKVDSPVDVDILRKYIAFAKQEIKPKLTEDAADEIHNFYMKMRGMQSDEKSPIPITVRQEEGIIRLSEGIAKSHLRSEVLREDAKLAISITESCIKAIGFDPETGTYDINKAQGNQSRSQLEKVSNTVTLLKDLKEEYGELPNYRVLKEEVAEKIKVSEIKAEELISKAKREL